VRNLIIAALLAGTVATPVLAQTTAPSTGFRVEAIAGYDAPRADGDSEEGVVYGAGIGYDFQLGGLAAGVEAEYTDTSTDVCAEDAIVVGDELCAGFDRDIYVGGRVGGIVGSNTLLYAKGGYTNQRISAEYDDGGTGVNDFNEGTTLDGFRVGGGAEFGFGSNAFVKAEYRYSNYEQGFKKHQGVVGIGLRF